MKGSPISKKQSSLSGAPQAQRSLFASRPFDPEPEETEDAAQGTHATVQQQPAGSPLKPFNFLTVPLHPAPAAPPNSTGAIQAKLTIGQPNDKYEQEADRVASRVVNQINTPPPAPIQREENLENEAAVQMPSVQREAMPEEEELQRMPLQRVAGGAGMVASPDLETSIAQARGSGQPLAQSIRAPLEQAMGADFSGVKVHTDAQSDRLNHSIQAKAFTTGQDVFFRQEEYNPGSRGGQELIAHELTHVVQQSGVEVQREPLPQQKLSQHPAMETSSASVGDRVIPGKRERKEKRQDTLEKQHSNKTNLPNNLKTGIANLTTNGDRLQAAFSQDPNAGLQEKSYGGVKSQYDTQNNLIELHIEAGANENGNMMQDFLTALWEAKDTITAGQQRKVGGLFMRPGGAQVLKMTMEMLGESIGQGDQLTAARTAKEIRKEANEPLWIDPTGQNQHDDILDSTVVPEHLAYRDAMVGVGGITMHPSGGGTSGGTQDMLANTSDAQTERQRYDAALTALKPFMSIAITIDLATVNKVIEMMEGKIGWFKLLSLRASYAVNKLM